MRTLTTSPRTARVRKLGVATLATTGAAAAALTLVPTSAQAAEKPASAQPQAAQSAPSASTWTPDPAPKKQLDKWIKEALKIMDKHDIPGSYEGIHRNIIRESGGDPNAVNDWDINAQNGVPSKGLLQVIQPTFDAYHVKGTKHDLDDPVANIVAACNYAADRYGSMDNVDSAY